MIGVDQEPGIEVGDRVVVTDPKARHLRHKGSVVLIRPEARKPYRVNFFNHGANQYVDFREDQIKR